MQFGAGTHLLGQGIRRRHGVFGRPRTVVVVHVVVGIVVVVDKIPSGDGVGEPGRPAAGSVVGDARGAEGGDQISGGDPGVTVAVTVQEAQKYGLVMRGSLAYCSTFRIPDPLRS